MKPGFSAAAGGFRELSMPFPLAVTLLELGEWLVGQGLAEDAAECLREAGKTFEELRAVPWLERLARVVGERVTTASP